MQRTNRKACRDILVAAVGVVLVALIDNVASIGLPVEVVPLVTAVLLYLYRILRDHNDTIAAIDDVR